jgi:glyceraldehyde-3-phosphate dehydrogenase/erythrose-4-phosphate dehydrogenase
MVILSPPNTRYMTKSFDRVKAALFHKASSRVSNGSCTSNILCAMACGNVFFDP